MLFFLFLTIANVKGVPDTDKKKQTETKTLAKKEKKNSLLWNLFAGVSQATS